MAIERLEGGVTTPRGFLAAATRAQIKPSGMPDLALLVSERPAVWAGVFTSNRVRAYNVDRNRALLAGGGPLRAVVVTAGNANVATGAQGIADTDELASLVAARLGTVPEAVAVAQTGVIGRPMPMAGVREAIPGLVDGLSLDGGAAAAEAICTTDTRSKQSAVRCRLGEATVTLGAMAKGAGMIHPNLATLLAFATTDANVAAEPLQAALRVAADRTFNSLTVDGCESTSDTVLLLANGLSGGPRLETLDDPRLAVFTEALTALLEPLAQQIAADGEGATTLLCVQVTGAVDEAQARLAARAVASSALLKCAVAGRDPNWGRIASAVGASGAEVDQTRLSISLNHVLLMHRGEPVGFDAAAVSESMGGGTVSILVDLDLGSAEAHAYGCDLTAEYVRINADYTT